MDAILKEQTKPHIFQIIDICWCLLKEQTL